MEEEVELQAQVEMLHDAMWEEETYEDPESLTVASTILGSITELTCCAVYSTL